MIASQFNTPTGAPANAAPLTSPSLVSSAPKRAAWIAPTAPYFQSEHALIDRAGRHIGVYGVAIYIAIERHADFSSGESFPTIEMLMEELDISEPTAIKYVALLEACGMISKRTSHWGSREQGPKSRSFYTVLRPSNWDFSSLPKRVKVVRKPVKVDLKEIKSNKKHLFNNNEKQQTTKARKAKKFVVVAESQSEEMPITDTQQPFDDATRELARELFRAGYRPQSAAEALAASDPDECRLQLTRLGRQKTPPVSSGGWLRRAIERRDRDDKPVAARVQEAPPKPLAARAKPSPDEVPSEADLVVEPHLRPQRSRTAQGEMEGLGQILGSIAATPSEASPPRPTFREAETPEVSSQQQTREAACERVFDALSDDDQTDLRTEALRSLSTEAMSVSKVRNSARWALVAKRYPAQVEAMIVHLSDYSPSNNSSSRSRRGT